MSGVQKTNGLAKASGTQGSESVGPSGSENSPLRRRTAARLLKLLPTTVVIVALVLMVIPGTHTIGLVLWLLLVAEWVIYLVRTKPNHCPRGHTDIGLYYGRWSCRTCYRQSRRRRST